MINFEIPVYFDVLTLLLSEDKADIKGAVKNQIAEGDPVLNDDVKDGIVEICEERGIDSDKIEECFDTIDLDKIMGYITCDEDRITLDYDEIAAINDARVTAFKVPCKFDTDRFINDYK